MPESIGHWGTWGVAKESNDTTYGMYPATWQNGAQHSQPLMMRASKSELRRWGTSFEDTSDERDAVQVELASKVVPDTNKTAEQLAAEVAESAVAVADARAAVQRSLDRD